MRVPDLDWPADLFVDAIADDSFTDGSAANLSLREPPLWQVLQALWMGRSVATRLHGIAA